VSGFLEQAVAEAERRVAQWRQEGLLEKLKESLLIYFVWIFPLLFLAAFVETFVTGPILYMLFGGQG
jgi:stage II sporulation protein M